MADLSTIMSYLPNKATLAGWGTGIFHTATYMIALVVIIIIASIIAYFIIRNLGFKNKIVIWEKINGRWEVAGRDRAKEIKYGAGGDTIFLLKKRKKYLPRPELQTGRRTYWYAIREDGEWINIDIDDIDLMMKQMKVKFLHPEMRHARTAMQRNLKDRLDKPKFMEKYGYILIPLTGFIIIALFMWLFMDKLLTAADRLNNMIMVSKDVMEIAKQVVSGLDRVCSGSGIT